MEFLAGVRTFTHATQVEEDLNMDEVYDALDSFGAASKIAFAESDIELEARCESWIGKIYHKALKKDAKAMSHFNSVIRLANSLRPRDVTQEEWYKFSKETLDAVREKRRLEEEAAQDRADKPFRDMVLADITNVKEEAKKGCKVFLQYINTNYTPTERKLTLTEEMLTEDKLKRLMSTRFALIYHPDKNVNEPRQIQILRAEIMKLINVFVEEYK